MEHWQLGKHLRVAQACVPKSQADEPLARLRIASLLAPVLSASWASSYFRRDTLADEVCSLNEAGRGFILGQLRKPRLSLETHLSVPDVLFSRELSGSWGELLGPLTTQPVSPQGSVTPLLHCVTCTVVPSAGICRHIRVVWVGLHANSLMRISQCIQSCRFCGLSACRKFGYVNGRKLFDRPATIYPHTAIRPLSVRIPSHKPSRYTLQVAAKNSETESQPAAEEASMADLSGVSKQSLVTGQLCLCGVAILWGSYSPVVRYIYSCPGAPTPAALTAVRTVIQAVALLLSDIVLRQHQFTSPKKAKIRRGMVSPNVSRNYGRYPAVIGNALSRLSSSLNSTSSKLWVAGAELGFWNFCGSTFQALGLQYTSATRGAFLIQVRRVRMRHQYAAPHLQTAFDLFSLHSQHAPDSSMQATSLLTPVMAALAGEKPSRSCSLPSELQSCTAFYSCIQPTCAAMTAEVSGWGAAAHLLELYSSRLTTLPVQSLTMDQQQHLAWVISLALSFFCYACWSGV